MGYFDTAQQALNARRHYLYEGEFIGKDEAKQSAEYNAATTQAKTDARNISALKTNFRICADAWRYQIEPALRSIESPLAGKLHDLFIDSAVLINYLEKSLNQKLLPGEPARLR